MFEFSIGSEAMLERLLRFFGGNTHFWKIWKSHLDSFLLWRLWEQLSDVTWMVHKKSLKVKLFRDTHAVETGNTSLEAIQWSREKEVTYFWMYGLLVKNLLLVIKAVIVSSWLLLQYIMNSTFFFAFLLCYISLCQIKEKKNTNKFVVVKVIKNCGCL